jgi:mono/diheme cytochrome c family protein
VNAQGVTGPDLDGLGGLDQERVLNAIERGGTGQGRMPAGLLTNEDARDVALYVARVAGR